MMRRVLIVAAALGAALQGHAAPLPSFPLLDLCGRVVEASFAAEARVRGIPGVSGTLGIDRTIPAHFRVVIEQYSGMDAAMAARVNEAMSFAGGGAPPARVALQINSPDARLFAGVRTVCVRGYNVAGDEGGTWTTYRELVRNPPTIPPAGTGAQGAGKQPKR